MSHEDNQIHEVGKRSPVMLKNAVIVKIEYSVMVLVYAIAYSHFA